MSRFEVKLCSWEHRTRYECVKAQSEKLGLSLSMEGLAYLNREGDKYELLDDLSFINFYNYETGKSLAHGNFVAVEKVDESLGDQKASPPKVFFAEAEYKKDGFGLDVLSCTIIDPAVVGGRCEF
ncbi:hypothetical protein LINGRAHAP2_LOCUS6272 [Linum grandiflorum]